MSYNIWNGFEWGKDTERKAQCIDWIKSKKPDVLALQELCGYTEEMLKEDAMQWGHPYVQLLKTEGYPTALTSNQPIQLKERKTEGFWHGLLHCQTYGIDFYVVHLSPADAEFRLREAQMITQLIQESQPDNFIILGDFNATSPFDAQALEKNDVLREKYRPKTTDAEHSNLRKGNFDYSVIAEFLACPAVDLALNKVDLFTQGHTFPAPALIGKYNHTDKSIAENRVRIDYILANPELGNSCTDFKIFNQEETHGLSDHYPVMAEFAFKN
ncbi:endonuclease/exonuclease/phosphatase family protein [Flagellimonas sp.]|uniref:endonuclease/exonuclease/phosphatase family protein n=1 Tax=Flagellimonas sp. TaxID=2058762 RepID=UPI003B518E0A